MIRSLRLSLAIAIAVVLPARGQDSTSTRIEIGPSIGYGAGIQSGSFNVFPGDDGCGVFTNGRVIGPEAIGGILQLPAFFGRTLGVTTRLGWGSSFSRYTAAPQNAQILNDLQNNSLDTISREYRYDASMQSVLLELLGRWQPWSHFALSFGPTIGLRYRATFEQTDNILAPENRSFANGERTLPMGLGAAFTRRPLAFGAFLGFTFPISIGDRTSLVPEIALRADILSAVSGGQWQALRGGIGLSLLFDITPPDSAAPPPPLPDTVIPPPPPRLEASITIRGLDEENQPSNAVVITVREVIFRQHTPLLPVVYFEHASSSFPDRYAMLDRSQTTGFTDYSVAELGPLELSHSLLNLVGYRMREDRKPKLILYTSATSDEPTGLAVERGERVRDYLVETWGIKSSRIEIRTGNGGMERADETTEDGRGENRRVVFASNSPDLLAPIETERIVREFNPPQIKLEPSIVAEAGVAGWKIDVRQGNDIVASFSDRDPEGIELSWRLQDDRIDSTLGMLVAELSVTDSAGQQRNARDDIELLMKRDSTIVEEGRGREGELQKISHSLVAFGYRSPRGDKQHELELEQLADLLHNDGTVQVTGYTDRIGDDRFNLELSTARAEYVVERLRALAVSRGVKNITFRIRGAGVETERFQNDLPEGRVLSRGAMTIVEQPLTQGPP